MSEVQNPWNIDPAIFQSLQAKSDAAPSLSKKESKAPYRLVEGGKGDYEKVQSWYQIGAIPGYHVGRVEIIFNRTMTAGFEARVQMLEHRWENPAFSPKWSWDMEKEEVQKLRDRAHTVLEHRTQKYQLAERHVHLIPLFHGTDKASFDSIFRTGFDNLATTDAGFFGKGIYNTSYAEYAYRVYCKNSGGQLICNWVAFYSAYPVAHGDIDKLMGKAKFQNYDAHYALVKPKDPAKQNESVYLPIEPSENPTYDELVVFESAQTLPRYVITLEADGIGLKVVVKKTTKSELLTAISLLIQKFKEKTGVKAALEKKMKSLQGADLTKELNSQEFGLYRLIGILNEQTALDDTILAELKLRLGLDISSSRKTTGWPLLDKYKDANLENPKTYPSDQKEQFELGLHYFNGTGIKLDFGRSAFYFILAAKQGHEMAAFLSGLHYEEGKGIRPNPEKVIRYYKQAADQGNIEAKYRLGNCYYEGKGVKQDYERAVRLFREAANEENANAIKRLGDCYFNGHEVKKDEKKAVELYAQAADLGSAEAKYALAACLLEGKGTDKNPDRAVELLKDLAYAEYVQGQYRLALCYAQGEGVNQDLEKAAKYFQLAADQGHREAQYEAGCCYKQSRGVKLNVQEAARYFKLAADQGHAEAQNHFGLCCEQGQGVSQSPEMAFAYFQKSAAQGNGSGIFHLGRCYEDGLGVKQDYEKALELYQRASVLGIEGAKKRLGKANSLVGSFHLNVKKDLQKAREFYRVALREGDPDAKVALGKVCYSLGDAHLGLKDYQNALQDFTEAKSYGNTECLKPLGELQYYFSRQLEISAGIDEQRVWDYYADAAANGSVQAREALANLYFIKGRRVTERGTSQRDRYYFYLKAAQEGSLAARDVLGRRSFTESRWESSKMKITLVTGDYTVTTLLPECSTLADGGDPLFQFIIGSDYYKRGLKADAMKYFKLAADQKHPGGQYGVGQCLSSDEKYSEEAVPFFQLAAHQDHIDALWALGGMYCLDKYQGRVKRDCVLAIKLMQRAIDLLYEFHPTYSLDGKSEFEQFYKVTDGKNVSLFLGRISSINMKEVFESFKTAASRGDSESQYILGYFYEHGKRDDKTAHKYFKLAADQGYLYACVRIGQVYFGVLHADYLQAMKYFQRAADKSGPIQNKLDEMFYSLRDDFIKQGRYSWLSINIEANKLFTVIESAASKKDSEAQYILGYFYLHGKKDAVTAQKYFRLAAEAGYEPAKKKIHE